MYSKVKKSKMAHILTNPLVLLLHNSSHGMHAATSTSQNNTKTNSPSV